MQKHLKSFFTKEAYLYCAILTLSITLIFVFIYAVMPSAFLYDDTLSYYIPYIKLQGDTFFSHQQIPFINFFQYLGHPLLSQGQTGVFYPLYYIAYISGIATQNLNNIGTSLMYIHILIAGLGIFAVLNSLRISGFYSLIGSLGYAFSGFNMVVGSNWVMASGYYAFLPILWLLLYKKNYLLFTIVNILTFSIGYIQFFLIINLFILFFFLLNRSGKINWRKLLLSYVSTVVISLPLLLPMFQGFIHSIRASGSSSPFSAFIGLRFLLTGWTGIIIDIQERSNMITPTLITFSPISLPILPVLIVHLRAIVTKIQHMYHSKPNLFKISAFLYLVIFSVHICFSYLFFGTIKPLTVGVMSVLDLTALILLFCSYESRNKYSILASLVLIFSLLSNGIYSVYGYFLIPYYILFRWPFKWYIIVAFGLSILVPYLYEKLVGSLKVKVAIVMYVILHVFIITIYVFSRNQMNFNNLLQPHNTFFVPEVLFDPQGRSVAVGYGGRIDQSKSLVANYSTYFGIFSWHGYDPILNKEKAAIIGLHHTDSIAHEEYYWSRKDVMNKYGVRYYVYPIEKMSEFAFLLRDNFVQIYNDGNMGVSLNTEAEFLISLEDGTPLSYTMEGNRIVVNTEGKEDSLIHLTLGFMKTDNNWYARNDQGKKVNVNEDQYSRLVVEIPPNSKSITIEYKDTTFLLGIITSITISTIFIAKYSLKLIRQQRDSI